MNESRAIAEAWVGSYEQAWRTPGTDALGDLFAADATYRMSPFEEAAVGLERIAALWERERQSAQEAFEMSSEVVAAEGDTAVVRVEVRYGEPAPNLYRDLWIVRFDEAGRCREFEEWPFWPEKGYSAEGVDR